jgi:hypothetical protein
VHGSNIINSGVYAFYTSICSDWTTVINAEENWWGTTDSATIEAMIYHSVDKPTAPVVDYIPCAEDSIEHDLITGVFATPAGNVPTNFALHQNYPNPFNSETIIRFTLERPADVRIDVYDVLGRPVKRIGEQHYAEPGTYAVAFDGTDRSGRTLPSGVYFYRLVADNVRDVRKMVLLK